MTTLVPYLNINTQLTPAPTTGTTSKQCLLIGQRNTNGTLTAATAGYTQPNYYIPFLLPSFTTGDQALQYLTNYGIQSQLGISFSLSLPAPTSVTAAGSITTLQWDTVPADFSQLTEFALSGTLTQSVPSSVSATVKSAALVVIMSNTVAQMIVYGTPAFIIAGSGGGALTLTGLNNVDYPDPNATDPIALMVWDFYQTALSANNSPLGAPSAYISILSDRDSTIAPDPAAIDLVAPTTASSSGTVTTLTYPIATAGLGYLPTTALGATTVSQDVALPTAATNFIYYADGKFLRLSSANAGISYSADGITWTATNKTTGTFTKVYWNSTIFVAVSTAGIWYSADGITWTVTSKSTGSFSDIYFANGKWVAASTVGLWNSTDGITAWAACTGATTGIFRSVAYGASKWVATCSVDIYTSTDGITFAALSFSANGFAAVVFDNGVFQIGSDTNSGIYYSTDAIAITQSSLTTKAISGFKWNGDKWIATTSVGLYYSDNGITWTACTGATTGVFTAVIYALNRWVATSSVGIYNSADGITFAVSTGATTGNFLSVAASSTLLVGAGALGLSISSTGITWSSNNTASGTYSGFVISGSNVLITITDVTGTFNNNDTVSIVLDNTQNAFGYLNNIELYGAGLQFPINDLNDITSTQSAFYNGIAAINQAGQVLNKHYLTYGFAGNATSLPAMAASLPAPNNYQNILVTNPYVPQFGNIPYDNDAGTVAGGRFAAGAMYMLANGDAPFPPLTKATINHFPVSSIASTTTYSNAPGGTGQLAIQQGWLPFYVNSSGVVAFLQSNTTATTLPNTNTVNYEFGYTHFWDCIRWEKKEIAVLFETISVLPNNQGSVLISPKFLSQFQNGIISILNQGQTLGILKNVPLYQGLVSVTQDSQNANQVDAYTPSQVITQLNGANVLINAFSSLVTNFNTGA